MAKLGVHQSVGSFVSATTVTVITDRVLQITVSAPMSDQAVSRANAVAAAFLSSGPARSRPTRRSWCRRCRTGSPRRN